MSNSSSVTMSASPSSLPPFCLPSIPSVISMFSFSSLLCMLVTLMVVSSLALSRSAFSCRQQSIAESLIQTRAKRSSTGHEVHNARHHRQSRDRPDEVDGNMQIEVMKTWHGKTRHMMLMRQKWKHTVGKNEERWNQKWKRSLERNFEFRSSSRRRSAEKLSRKQSTVKREELLMQKTKKRRKEGWIDQVKTIFDKESNREDTAFGWRCFLSLSLSPQLSDGR